ncbi:MAG: hypothetical protein RR189_01790, partial [Bacilli bacterium]
LTYNFIGEVIMFGTSMVSSGLTLGKVIGGISKTLSVANQIIPLYQQAKPMISNAKKVMSILKEFNKPSSTSNINKTKINNNKTNVIEGNIKKSTNNSTPLSSPVFFQ